MVPQTPLSQRLSEFIDSGVIAALGAMPGPLCSSIGARLSPLGRMTHAGADRDARALFTALRPDWAASPATLEAALKRLWAAVGRTYAEFAINRRLVAQKRVTIANVGALDDALASGRPVILAFVHTGNWELSGMDLAFHFEPRRAFAIYDPPRKSNRAEIVFRLRRQMPVDLIPMSRLVWRDAMTRLKEPGGGVLWIAADEYLNVRVAAPFFGRAPRIDGNLGKIARLALRTGAIVVPFYGERHPGLRFTTNILPPLTFEGSASDDDAILSAVAALNATLTPHVIRLLDQWYWALYYRGNAWPTIETVEAMI